MDSNTREFLAEKAREIRIGIIEAVHSASSGHPGGSLSAADILAYLYFKEMNIDSSKPDKPGRDRFVLSKGHASPALYSTLSLAGYFPREDLKTFRKLGSYLQGHPDMKHTPGVEMSTGSLGQGVSAACGMALGSKMNGDGSRVYALVGDGESEEGEVWEAAMFAAHYKLDNLICFVDDNKYQLDGAVDKVMSHGKGIGAKFAAFGWNVIELQDGNDVEQIYDAVQLAYDTKGVPTCIVLNTVKGLGATFAEGTGAHSSQPSKEQWDEAIAAAEKKLAEIKAQ